MAGTYIDITAADGGKFRGYLRLPPAGKGPGLVVEQEIFGINENVRFVCEEYARQGFVALAPDLFWRMQPGIDLDYSEKGWARAFECFQKFDVDAGVKDIAATVKAPARSAPSATASAASSPISPPRAPTATPRSATTASASTACWARRATSGSR
jgi:carboxymethylenebutenolidase